MKIRIAHLITDLDVGGAEVMLARLLERMDRDRFDSEVISLIEPGAVAPRMAAAAVPVTSLGMRPGVPAPRGVVRLTRLLRRKRPDILQTWLYHADVLGTLAGAMARVPSVVWNIRAGDVDLSMYGSLSALTRKLGAVLSGWPEVVVANSRAGREAHERLGYHPRRWLIIPNGIDTARFRPQPADRDATRASLGVPAGALLVGTIARFDPVKGHERLIEAVGRVAASRPALHLLLAGRGVSAGNAELAGWIARAHLDGRVTLLDERHDVERIDAALDVAVMPSTTEAFPNAVAEAMACGVPCVVSDVGDAAHLVGPTGWIGRRPLAEDLANALDEALSSATERRRRGDAARARIEAHFSLDRAVEAYANLYEGLAGSKTS
ncbi:MAG TPA: glycosyltransferase [Vicinamibacterales bacterium]|nr:glycosyltransferase [Vicinamibacterales bacterium]